MQLSQNFTLAEFTASQAAARAKPQINNVPWDPAILANLEQVANTLEGVRALLGHHPIWISSGYRCPELNKLVKGAKNSAHVRGLAVDFTCPRFGSPKEIVRAIALSGMVFDQLILEFPPNGWVHLGLTETGTPRKQVLIIDSEGTRPW